jgi:hypothetical protein
LFQVLPVLKSQGAKEVLGLIDVGSIRMAVKMHETMEVISRSMWGGKKQGPEQERVKRD